jgi:hypothetical protein
MKYRVQVDIECKTPTQSKHLADFVADAIILYIDTSAYRSVLINADALAENRVSPPVYVIPLDEEPTAEDFDDGLDA